MATFLHELCSILSPEQCSIHVFDILKKLLQDKEECVWSALFAQLDCILKSFFVLVIIQKKMQILRQLSGSETNLPRLLPLDSFVHQD